MSIDELIKYLQSFANSYTGTIEVRLYDPHGPARPLHGVSLGSDSPLTPMHILLSSRTTKIKAEDLDKDQEYLVKQQGTNITPVTVKVRVSWVAPDRVIYQAGSNSKLQETTIERFLEIINQ